MKMVSEQTLMEKIDNLSKPPKFLTFSWQRAIIAIWMLAMAFGSAGFIWYGITVWEDPFQSIINIAFGIWIILLAVMRIIHKELEGKKERREQ